MTIRSEIEGKLAAYAASKSIPVSYENVGFNQPNSGPFLEIYLFSIVRHNRDLAATKVRSTGLFQINCYAPVGDGMAVVEALVEDIVNTYPVLPKVGTVSIEIPLHASTGYIVDGFMCVPVTGRFRVES